MTPLDVRLGVVFWLLVAAGCTHPDGRPEAAEPVAAAATEPYAFPAKFYVEQNLAVTTPEDSHQLLAQLDRHASTMTLVLMDRMTTVVLARVTMAKDQAPVLNYLSPHVPSGQLPILDIAEAIRFLYQHAPVTPVAGIYTAADPAGRWTYTWQKLRVGATCRFPEDLTLRFKDARYLITIALEQLDCS